MNIQPVELGVSSSQVRPEGVAEVASLAPQNLGGGSLPAAGGEAQARGNPGAGGDASSDKDLRAVVDQALSDLKEPVGSQGIDLKFSINKDTNTLQVEVRDVESHKVIRKIPQDELLKLSASIKKSLAGTFLNRSI